MTDGINHRGADCAGQKIDLIVTRHRALVEYLRETGVVGPDVPVLEHVHAVDVVNLHVVGILPLLAGKVGMTLQRIREVAGPPVRYVVTRDR